MSTDFALRAARREVDRLGWQLQDGLSGLGSVASVAALFGLFGSVWAIIGMFAGEQEVDKPYVTIIQAHLSRALWWNAFGLLPSITASIAYRSLLERWRELALEMDLVLKQLPDVFVRLGGDLPSPERTPTTAAALAERAATRVRKTITDSNSRGLAGLATITSVTPFFGLFGTCLWITLYPFKGMGSSRSQGLAMVATSVFESLAFNAAGLVLAISAAWARHSLKQRRDGLDREMRVAIFDLGRALRQLSVIVNRPASR